MSVASVSAREIPGGASRRAQAASDLAPDATLKNIQSLLARDDVAGAQAALDDALRQHPADPALRNFAGVVAAQRGASDEAVRQFERAIALAPRQPAAYENLGRLYQEQSARNPAARQKALATYQGLLAIEPANPEGLFQSAFLLLLDGRFAESRSAVERLPQKIRDRPQARAVLAVDLAGTGDARGADDLVAALTGDPALTAADVMAVAPAFDRLASTDVPRRMLEALVTRQLATPGALHRLGRLHLDAKRYREARDVLDQAIARGGPNVPVLLDAARAADLTGDHEGALGYLAHARALEPQNAAVHFLFGIVCVEMDLGAEAYESLKKAVALEPDHPGVNYLMGVVSMHRHDPSEALPYFEKYIRLQPDDPRGRFALGMARFYAKDFDGAVAELTRVARRPETAAGANYFLARIARQAGRLDEARRHVDAALEANAQYADAWAELGLLQTRAGQYSEAEQALSKALSIEPDNYTATVNLTALYTRTRDPRLESQQARLTELQQKRDEQSQQFLRLIQVVPR